MGLISSCLCLLLLGYISVGGFINYCKLRQFKGPPLAAFSRFSLFWKSWNARLNVWEYEAIQKYGPVCRIGPNLLVTGDADIIRHMNAPGSKWTRSGWYDGMKLDPRLDTVFSTRDENLHAELKAKEAGAYNGRDIDTLESDMDARITDLINLIRKSYNGVTMDFSLIARFFTLDLLSTIAFGGHPFGFMAANRDLWDYNKQGVQFTPIFQIIVHHESFRRFLRLPFIRNAAVPKKTDKTGLGAALGFAHRAVQERYAPNARPRKDMLGHFIRKGLSQTQCEAEAFLQIIAGSDSTTTVLRSTLYLLVANPTAYNDLRREIDKTVGGYWSGPPRIIDYAQTQKMPYLQACIWEGLRMYPPLGDLKAKLAPPGGDTIKGIFFPEGTEVAINDESLCRNKAIFGDDADFYLPDRWMTENQERKVRYRQTVETIFGTGRFQCLGRHIAMMELHKTLAELIRRFDWIIADPTRGIDQKVYGIYVQSDMNLAAWPRR